MINVSVPLAAAAGIAAALLTAGAVAVFILAGTGRLDRPAGKREDKDV